MDLEAGQEHCTQVFFTSRWKVAQIRAGQKILDSIQRVPECQNDVNTYWLVSEWFLIHSNTTPTHFPTEISILSFTERKFTKWAEENLCKIGAAQSAQDASKGATAHFGNRALGSKNQPIMAGQKCIKVIPANLDVLCKKLLSFFCSWQVFCPMALTIYPRFPYLDIMTATAHWHLSVFWVTCTSSHFVTVYCIAVFCCPAHDGSTTWIVRAAWPLTWSSTILHWRCL